MERLERSLRTALLAVLLAIVCGAAPAVAQGPTATPLPTFKGPIPITTDSYPFMMSSKLQKVVDLPKAGYMEEEWFISGGANVYDWAADGRLSVKVPNAPYTTRILLRRPTDPARASGNVIVGLNNSARRFDFDFAWGVSHDHFMESGDVFVLITLAEGNMAGAKAFDPVRYAPLSMANPNPDETCAVGRGGPQKSTFEDGLRWDILSQVGALLKAARPGGPLAGFNIQRAYMVTFEGTMTTYMAAIHPNARLANGKPVYDAYVQHRYFDLGPIRRCAPPIAADDPRQKLWQKLEVPFIRLVTETDVVSLARTRRPDGDAPGDQYRLYEVAGGAHADAWFYPFYPPMDVLKKVNSPYPYLGSWPFANQCEPWMGLQRTPINTYALDVAFANLTRWVRDGVAPPKAARMTIENAGTPEARIARDRFGNGLGGMRSPYLDVPSATYVSSNKGEGFCDELGRTDPFDWATMNKLYGSREKYAAKVGQSVDALVKARFLTESDGKKIKAEAATGNLSLRYIE